jgi:hypothetical protein
MKRTVVIKDAESTRTRGGETIRSVLTLVCALIADGGQWLLPVLWPVCDGAMVVAVLILWGLRWEVCMALIPELIPGLALAPTWTIFAGYLILAQRSNGTGPARKPDTHARTEKPVEPI